MAMKGDLHSSLFVLHSSFPRTLEDSIQKTRINPMPWPTTRRLLGTKVARLDAPEKATGRAKYSFDINRPGMLHGKILRCPYAHATLKKLDTSAAEKMPGVAAIHLIAKEGKTFEY